MTRCRLGCGAQIKLVQLANGRWHPVNIPLVKVPEGRVVWDEDSGEWSILDARLRRKDGTVGPRCGQAWPVDGGTYSSHMDTCTALAEERALERLRARRDEAGEPIDPYEWQPPRCRYCHLPMDEELAGVEGWISHPSCDPRHRPPGPDEVRRLTGRMARHFGDL